MPKSTPTPKKEQSQTLTLPQIEKLLTEQTSVIRKPWMRNSPLRTNGWRRSSSHKKSVPDDVRRCLRKSALMRSCDSRRMSIGAIGPRLFCRSCRSHARLTASSVNPSRCIASKTPSNRDSSAEPSGPKRDASDDSVTLSPACSLPCWPSTREASA